MVCPSCINSKFHLSHFRRQDLPRLLIFRYPIRCATCSHRMYGSLLFAIQLKRSGRGKHHALANS